jgi:hypothetical protein
MAKKISLIGFVKSKYKSVKYQKEKEVLSCDNFIKFYYGPSADKPIVGKISKIFPKGVEVYTDYGWMNVIWDRIERVFKEKTSGKLKETRILAVNGTSPIPLIDAAIDRILLQIKNNNIDVNVSDKRINKSTQYSRIVKIKSKSNMITIELPNKDALEAVVKGLKRKAAIKLNKNGKIPSAIIKKIVNAADEMQKPIKKGTPLNISML